MKTKANEQAAVTLLAALLIFSGILFRVRHLFHIRLDEPFRLGGLFYEFSQQIIQHGYALPKIIPFYSTGGIPFAYPPLGFYAQTLIFDIFSPPRFLTVNLLPPIIAALCVPSFYFFLQRLTTNSKIILASLFAYAFMPAAFINQIEAAGLAEAFGTLALIWYAYFLLRFQDETKSLNILWAGILLAAAVTASPGSAVASVIFSLLFTGRLILRQAEKKNIGKLLMIGGVGLLVSAPYWWTVASNHGIDIFFTPMLGQFHGPEVSSFIVRFFKAFFEFNYAGGDYSLIWNTLILLGLLWHLFKERLFIPIAFFSFALIPRESVWLTALVAPLLVAAGLIEIVLPFLSKTFKGIRKESTKIILLTSVSLTVFSILTFNAIAAVETIINDAAWQISADQIQSLEQAQDEIPREAGVIIIGNEAFVEWAPQLLQREVLNVEYGLEWQPDEFAKVIALNQAIQNEESWDKILKTIQQDTGYNGVYIISSKINELDSNTQRTNIQTVFQTPFIKVEKLSPQGK